MRARDGLRFSVDRQALRGALSVGLAAILSAGPAVAADHPPTYKVGQSDVLSIAHDPLKCLAEGVRPVVDARVRPGEERKESLVFFRAAGNVDYYYTQMTGPAEDVVAFLPRPLPGLKGVEYYVEAIDRKLLGKQTPEYGTPVLPEKDLCLESRALGLLPPAEGLTIGLTREGQNPVPPGFDARDIAKVILVSGATVLLATAIQSFSASSAAAGTAGAGSTGGSAGAAGTVAAGGAGGGMSTLAIVGVGVAVAGGVTAVVVANTSSNEPPVFGGASVTPTSGSLPLRVTATAQASDKDNDPVTVTWDFGVPGGTATGTTASFTYQQVGSFTVRATATDGKGGSTQTTAGTVQVTASTPPRFLAASATWSQAADLDVRLVGPGGLDVATQAGGQRVAAGCGVGSQTEAVTYQGTGLPAGAYTLLVRHAGPCGQAPAAVAFSYSVQSDSASKCGGLGSVSPGVEVTACTFTLP
ncbi:MAG: PKD domain-containing protein [Thermoanaerobaculia bacterium]